MMPVSTFSNWYVGTEEESHLECTEKPVQAASVSSVYIECILFLPRLHCDMSDVITYSSFRGM